MIFVHKRFLLVVLLTVTIGACNIFGTSPGLQPVDHTNGSDVEALLGHTWVMLDQQSSEGKELEYLNEEMYKIEFHADSSYVHGKTGCGNTFSGSYTAHDEGSITIDVLIASQAGCFTEDMYDYLDNLENIDRFEVTRGRLKLGFGKAGVFLYTRE